MRTIIINHRKTFLVLFALLFSALMPDKAQAQNIQLSDIKKNLAISGDEAGNQVFNIVTANIAGLENADKVVFGIGSLSGLTDVLVQTIQIQQYDGKYYLDFSNNAVEIFNNRLRIQIPFAIDMENKFLTVYVIAKDGSFSNKLSIPAK
jgi:hypothetical protein